jgi:hypothetical protein
MKARTTSAPLPGLPVKSDFDTLYGNLLAQLGGPVEIETPQLGRVQYPRPVELYQAMNYLRMAQNAANGIAATGVITIGHDRGLWPCKGCCTDEELYSTGR